MQNRKMKSISRMVSGALLVPGVGLASDLPSNPFDFGGDFRTGYFWQERDDRSGTNRSDDDFRFRIRLGWDITLTQALTGKLRWAGRYSTEESVGDFELRAGITPGSDTLPMGESTIDEGYFNYAFSPNWRLTLGRFQSKFELAGIPRKSLDRNTSSNTNISWTDGGWLVFTADSGWRGHLIVQRNDEDGSSELRRRPLDFEEDDSRVSAFLAWENDNVWGPIVQRGLDFTYLPDALHDEGVGSGSVEDYLALVGRLAARWPVGGAGMKFLLGGEAGYAPNTPEESVVGTGTGSDDVDGYAYQISANLLDIRPRHSFGLVYAESEAGWLISPDFRPNNQLIEGRYRFQIDKPSRLEIRLRQREDLDKPVGADEKQTDLDLYIRYTRKI
jgi:hypothetical protein